MRRTTMMLPDDLARLVELEQQRLGISTAELVRRALTAYLQGRHSGERRLPFAGIGASARSDVSENVESILAREWGSHRPASRRR